MLVASALLPRQPTLITVDAERPYAQAIAITGERILDVGDNSTIRALAGRRTRVVDLGGRDESR